METMTMLNEMEKMSKPKDKKKEIPFTVSYDVMGQPAKIDKTFKNLTESNKIIMDLLSKGQIVILKPQT